MLADGRAKGLRVTYDLRSGEPDSLDQMVAITFANVAMDLISEGLSGRMVAIRDGKYAHIDLPGPGVPPRRVDVPTMYNEARFRPRYSDRLGHPMLPVGQPATLKAVVTATAPGSAKATGAVTFKDGGTVLGTASLVNGVATLPVTWKQGPGPHSTTASYAGPRGFPRTISPDRSARSLPQLAGRSLRPARRAAGCQILTLRAYVETPGNWTQATGSYTFRDGTKVLGTVSIQDASTLVTLANLKLSPGTHTLTAEYTGNDLLLSALGQVPMTVGAAG